MRLRRAKVVHATLMLSHAGVMVEALDQHAFNAQQDGASKVGPHHQEVDPPPGAAEVAVQFVHTLKQSFAQLQVFRLVYYRPSPPRDLWEAYLAPARGSDLRLRAVPVGPETLSRDQRRVLVTLLSGSDPQAWEASPEFRHPLEKA